MYLPVADEPLVRARPAFRLTAIASNLSEISLKIEIAVGGACGSRRADGRGVVPGFAAVVGGDKGCAARPAIVIVLPEEHRVGQRLNRQQFPLSETPVGEHVVVRVVLYGRRRCQQSSRWR